MELEWEDKWIKFLVFKIMICGNFQNIESVKFCFVYTILHNNPFQNWWLTETIICSWYCTLAHLYGSIRTLRQELYLVYYDIPNHKHSMRYLWGIQSTFVYKKKSDLQSGSCQRTSQGRVSKKSIVDDSIHCSRKIKEH